MEGIIVVFIIIIIAFNLLNVFLKAIRGSRGGQRKDTPTGTKQPPAGVAEAKDFWEVGTTRFSAKKPEDATSDQNSDHKERKEYKGVAYDNATSPSGESVKPSLMAFNLKKILSQKESLAAAVFFHEVLSHPKAMRRKS